MDACEDDLNPADELFPLQLPPALPTTTDSMHATQEWIVHAPQTEPAVSQNSGPDSANIHTLPPTYAAPRVQSPSTNQNPPPPDENASATPNTDMHSEPIPSAATISTSLPPPQNSTTAHPSTGQTIPASAPSTVTAPPTTQPILLQPTTHLLPSVEAAAGPPLGQEQPALQPPTTIQSGNSNNKGKHTFSQRDDSTSSSRKAPRTRNLSISATHTAEEGAPVQLSTQQGHIRFTQSVLPAFPPMQ